VIQGEGQGQSIQRVLSVEEGWNGALWENLHAGVFDGYGS
jgi:hypothetical protein